MFHSSFPPVVSKRAYLRYLCLCAYSCVQHICFLFFFLLCTICFQFLWMVHFFLPLRYCYACYIPICILNQCNHGNDLSEIKITTFFCTIYTIGKYLRLLLISSLYTYNVRIHEGVMYEAWFTDLL